MTMAMAIVVLEMVVGVWEEGEEEGRRGLRLRRCIRCRGTIRIGGTRLMIGS